MPGKGKNKGSGKGNGKSNHYTAGNRGGGGAKKLSEIMSSSDSDDSDEPLKALLVGDDTKVDKASKKLLLASYLKKQEHGNSGTQKIEVTSSELATIKKVLREKKKTKKEKKETERDKNLIAMLKAEGLLTKAPSGGNPGAQKSTKTQKKAPDPEDIDDDDDDDDEETEVAPKKPTRNQRMRSRLAESEAESTKLAALLSTITGMPETEAPMSFSDGELEDSPSRRTRHATRGASNRAMLAARMHLQSAREKRKASMPPPTPSPKKSTRKVRFDDKVKTETTSEESSGRKSCADLMAMAKASKSSGKSFDQMTPKQQANGLLDSLAGAIRMVAVRSPEANFSGKPTPSLAADLEPFVMRCLGILEAAGKAEKKAKLQYLNALKEGVLKDGPISVTKKDRETDSQLLSRVVYNLLLHDVNPEKDAILKAIWDME